MSYVHQVPGRLRLRDRRLAHESRATRSLCHQLRALPGVDDVAHRPRASSLVVLYDPTRLDPETLWTHLEAHGLGAAPALPVPMPAPRAARPAPTIDARFMNSSATTLGAAFGRALFGAVLKSSVERGVASLVTAAIR
ncbi:hypothetical protein SAMN05421742_101397 [Roseospirillum parvum]|uniref:Uncharacterized protein n=2 Tax=Roseospirillum parvum TaxID=83401 RepID=A0A1G7UPY9_9PROT|nr:hypothetical protein SAMN05421742_101397 [Roseospirillum parvum]